MHKIFQKSKFLLSCIFAYSDIVTARDLLLQKKIVLQVFMLLRYQKVTRILLID